MKKVLQFVFFLGFGSIPSYGQDFQDQLSKVSPVRYISHKYENDVFTQTDRYYTQGIRYELVFPYLQHSSLRFILPGFKYHAVNYYGVSFEQKCFTPTVLASDTVRRGDRPYAAALYSGRFLVSNDSMHHQRLKTEVDVGLLGPCALCEEEQKAIHRVLVDQQPRGWGFQIKQDVILDYSVAYDKGLVNTGYFEFLFQSKAEVGTLYDKAIAGGMLRAGKLCSWFSMLGPGETAAAKSMAGYIFLKGWVQGVGYDATMQGGMFDRNNVYVIADKDITRLVYGYEYGLVYSFRKLILQYSLVHLTPEFNTGFSHAWGHITIAIAF